jgi:hypothetical protein
MILRYDPSCEYSRQHLAISIASRLEEAGFERVKNPGFTPGIQILERLYERKIENTDLHIQVCTTIIDDNAFGMSVRTNGKDAIRINVRAPDVKRPIISETRVNRTGQCENIVDRMIQRARDAYRLGKHSGKCDKCGSQRARSKSGKWYCAAICWKTKEEKVKDRAEWLSKKQPPRRRRRWY